MRLANLYRMYRTSMRNMGKKPDIERKNTEHIHLTSVLRNGILGKENRVWYTGVCVEGQMKRETGEIPVQGRCCVGVAVA